MTKSNIKKLIEAIGEFRFGSLNLEIEDFMTPENIVQLGYEPCRIDLRVDVEGVDFEKCFERRTEAELDGVDVILCQGENFTFPPMGFNPLSLCFGR